MPHLKARGETYLTKSDKKITRFPVPDDKVPWNVDWPEYAPVEFTADHVLSAEWADPQLGQEGFKPAWNSVDGKVDRRSFEGEYKVVNGRPLNPSGRTGLSGRGVLGKWGPNHAADPIVTRWKKENGKVVTDKTSGKPILQFVCIQRRDSGAWAIPGGMVDPGEVVTLTLKREFMEEAMSSLTATEEELKQIKESVNAFFETGQEVYKGYVDDPRNTDNSWMETVAYNFHDETDSAVGKLKLQAGDDAQAVRWADLDGKAELYASHAHMLSIVAEKWKAHW